MGIARLPLAFSALVLLATCQPVHQPIGPLQSGSSLQGSYQVLSLTERPYTDTNSNDLVLFDTLSQGCGSQPVLIFFSDNKWLTTDVAPECIPYTNWLTEAGLVNTSRWEVVDGSLIVTTPNSQASLYTMSLTKDQLELSWEGADSSYVGLYGQLVTYSLALKRL